MGDEKKQYIYLITTLIKIRSSVKGFNSSISINFNNIDTGQIKDKKKLFEMLNNFKTDEVPVNYTQRTVIKDYEIDEKNNDIIIIRGSSIKKLKLYAEMIMGNKIDSTNRHIVSLLLPPETKWESITIKFKDGHDVDILIPGRSKAIQSSYIEMGFQNLKTRRSNNQWRLLIILANNHRKLSWNNPEAKDNLKKQKQLLSEKLKKYFNLVEDPFRLYREEKLYEIKLNLIPEGEQFEELVKEIDNDGLGIKEYHDQNTPSVQE